MGKKLFICLFSVFGLFSIVSCNSDEAPKDFSVDERTENVLKENIVNLDSYKKEAKIIAMSLARDFYEYSPEQHTRAVTIENNMDLKASELAKVTESFLIENDISTEKLDPSIKMQTLSLMGLVILESEASKGNTRSIGGCVAYASGLGSLYKAAVAKKAAMRRSEEHTSELQSHYDLVCRLLLEKKKF